MSQLPPEAHALEMARVEYVQEQIEIEADNCRYCKGMRTRRHNKIEAQGQRAWEKRNPEFLAAALKRADEAMCSTHLMRARMVYRTSPASENYWAS